MKLKTEPWLPDQDAPNLTSEQTARAVQELYTSFPKLERGFLDPPVDRQKIALFSFVPAEENKFGIYGFAKVRGVFDNEEHAKRHARKIIQKFDSVNHIHHVEVGKPFPILADFTKFTTEQDKIILDDALVEAEKALVQKDVDAEQQSDAYMAQRKEALLKDVDPESQKDPVHEYITKREKVANLSIVYEHCLLKVNELQNLLTRSWSEMQALETPEILQVYKQVHDDTMKECGLDKDLSEHGVQVRNYFNVLPRYDFLKEISETSATATQN